VANYLTQGRTALLDALRADATMAAGVKTWFEFAADIRRRYALEPSACPLAALYPAAGQAVRTSNGFRDVVQRLTLDLATDGQDAEPCEELLAAALDRLAACDETCLDLAAEGLTGLDVEEFTLRMLPEPAGARVLWHARITVALHWERA